MPPWDFTQFWVVKTCVLEVPRYVVLLIKEKLHWVSVDKIFARMLSQRLRGLNGEVKPPKKQLEPASVSYCIQLLNPKNRNVPIALCQRTKQLKIHGLWNSRNRSGGSYNHFPASGRGCSWFLARWAATWLNYIFEIFRFSQLDNWMDVSWVWWDFKSYVMGDNGASQVTQW